MGSIRLDSFCLGCIGKWVIRWPRVYGLLWCPIYCACLAHLQLGAGCWVLCVRCWFACPTEPSARRAPPGRPRAFLPYKALLCPFGLSVDCGLLARVSVRFSRLSSLAAGAAVRGIIYGFEVPHLKPAGKRLRLDSCRAFDIFVDFL